MFNIKLPLCLVRTKTYVLQLVAAVLLFTLGYYCRVFTAHLKPSDLLPRGDSGDVYRGVRLKAIGAVMDFRTSILTSNKKQWDEACIALESAYAQSLCINAVLAQRLAHVCFKKRDFAQAFSVFSSMLNTSFHLDGFYKDYVLGNGMNVAEIYISIMVEDRVETADDFLADVKTKVEPESKVGQYIALLFSPSEPSMSDPRMALLTSDTIEEIKEYRALMAEFKGKTGKNGERDVSGHREE